MVHRTVRHALVPVAALALSLGALSGLSAQQQGGGEMQETRQAGLEVAEAVLTTAVEDREPVDTVSVYEVTGDVGRVFCWNRITGAGDSTQVVHIWYYKDQEMARVPMTVAGGDWRAWSSKAIIPAWTGAWRVRIVDADGNVLETVSFSVEKGEARMEEDTEETEEAAEMEREAEEDTASSGG